MKLRIIREPSANGLTSGVLFVDGHFECFTAEDEIRASGVKIAGKTAIPPGTYTVTITMSNRFKRLLPLLNAVPQFEGIRIHPGNTIADTEGCILVGAGRMTTGVSSSKIAFDHLFERMRMATDPITISVENPL